MVGGEHLSPRGKRARAVVTGLLGGTIAFCTAPTLAQAAERTPGEQKSVVTATAKTAGSATAGLAPSGAEELPQVSGALAPIANVSEYEPDLADPPATAARSAEVVVESTGRAEAVVATVSDRVRAEGESDAQESAPQDAAGIAPASFFGATPGLTSRQELVESWGAPADGDDQSVTIAYQLEAFPQVIVGFDGDVVDSIDVTLDKPRDSATLIGKLELGSYKPLVVRGDAGEITATVVPERGVTLRHQDPNAMALATDASAAGDAETVYGLAVHSIRAEDFARRAASHPRHAYSARQADLQVAVDLRPDHAEALRRLSEIALTTGRPALAERLAAEALEIDEDSPECRLQLARALTKLARYDRAVDECRVILDRADAAPIVRAKTLYEMGVLAAFGSKEVAKRSVPLLNRAIELADELAASPDEALARTAGELLVDAHLAVASGIAAGEWQKKDEYVGQWISRASALAEKLIADDPQYLPLRLKVASEALAAGSRLQPPIDPKLWVAEAEETIEELAPLAADKAAQDEFNWRLGVAYCYATEIQHRRGQAASALRYGDLAQTQLEDLIASRDESPLTNLLVGRLYFQIGAVHAVHREDHQAACRWYDRSTALLLTPAPVTNLVSPGRHGDALVSMGVSYWHIGQRDRAVDLTKQGMQFVEEGVAAGLLAETALDVPEGNLAAMTRALERVDSIESPARPRTQIAGRRGATFER